MKNENHSILVIVLWSGTLRLKNVTSIIEVCQNDRLSFLFERSEHIHIRRWKHIRLDWFEYLKSYSVKHKNSSSWSSTNSNQSKRTSMKIMKIVEVQLEITDVFFLMRSEIISLFLWHVRKMLIENEHSSMYHIERVALKTCSFSVDNINFQRKFVFHSLWICTS